MAVASRHTASPKCNHGVWATACASGKTQKIKDGRQVCIEIASGVVAALEQSNLGPGAKRGHFAPVQHLVALRNEGEGVRWCCDPSAAHGLKLIDEAGRKKMFVLRRASWSACQGAGPGPAPDEPLD